MHNRRTYTRYSLIFSRMVEIKREWWSPLAWPRWGRVLFFGLLPATGPLWLLAVVVGGFAWAVFSLLRSSARWLCEVCGKDAL